MKDGKNGAGKLESFSFLSRRRFLKLGLGVAGLGVAGGGGLWALRGSAPHVEGLRVLSAQDYRTLRNIADAHLPRGGAFEIGAADFDLARMMDTFLADEPQANVSNLKSALLLVEYGPVIFDYRLTTFSNLAEQARATHWETWFTSDLLLRRQAARAFASFLSLMFYDQPEVWPHIGYPGPALKTEDSA